jgi:hypothetical protein
MNLTRLHELARRINQREQNIEQLKNQTVAQANAAVCEALLQGQDLIAAKAECRHGEWLDWCATYIPRLSLATVNRYMRVATVYLTKKELIGAESLRAALLLCQEDKPGDDKPSEPRSWPAFQEGMGRAWKFVEYVRRYPIGQWPNDTVEALRDDLLPVAAQLWPEKFEP